MTLSSAGLRAPRTTQYPCSRTKAAASVAEVLAGIEQMFAAADFMALIVTAANWNSMPALTAVHAFLRS